MEFITRNIKQHDADRLANSILRVADKMFQNPEIQAEFKQCQEKRQQKEV